MLETEEKHYTQDLGSLVVSKLCGLRLCVHDLSLNE